MGKMNGATRQRSFPFLRKEIREVLSCGFLADWFVDEYKYIAKWGRSRGTVINLNDSITSRHGFKPRMDRPSVARINLTVYHV